MRLGRLRRVGPGDNLIDMVYVENAAAAHLAAADRLAPASPVAGRAYYITQGEPVNCWAWINQILTLAGIRPIEKSISFLRRLACGRRVRSGVRRAADPQRTADDPVPGRAASPAA